MEEGRVSEDEQGTDGGVREFPPGKKSFKKIFKEAHILYLFPRGVLRCTGSREKIFKGDERGKFLERLMFAQGKAENQNPGCSPFKFPLGGEKMGFYIFSNPLPNLFGE